MSVRGWRAAALVLAGATVGRRLGCEFCGAVAGWLVAIVVDSAEVLGGE
jgi:hypothetical protein